MIHFTQVRKSFAGGVHAVDGVTLHIPRGQCCVLLGASGAGKTTLLRMINGLVQPTEGSVQVNGTRLARGTVKSIRRVVGMVHQRFNLTPRLTVLDNVMCGALPVVNTPRAMVRWFPQHLKRKACELLAQVGLEESQLYRRAADLSGGQQQRVAIARAFMLDPLVLLADEPVASLDPATSQVVLDLIRDASRQRGATVVCSLHQVEFARAFADRVVAMRQGRVIFDGPPQGVTAELEQEIYQHAQPASPAVATGEQTHHDRDAILVAQV